MRKYILLFLLALTGCAEKTADTVQAPTQIPNIDAAQEDVIENTVADIPQKSVQTLVQTIAPSMTSSAIAHFMYQPCVTEPSENEILYLMRAARYKTASDYVMRAPQTKNMQFIALKSRILSEQCSSQNPCAPGFETLQISEKILEPVIEYWRIRALIEDGEFANAIASIQTFPENLISKMRSLVLETGKALEKRDSYDKDDVKMLDMLKALTTKVSKGANAFESASLAYMQMRIDEAAGREKSARAKQKQIVLHYPATQMSLWPELADDFVQSFSVNEKMSRIQRLISHFDYDNARRELKQVIEDASTPAEVRDKAEWQLASVSMTNSEDPQLSEKIYRKWAKKSGKLQEEAVFGIARSLSRQLKYPEAIKALEHYDRKYPRGKYHSRSLYLRGWYYFDLRENAKARPLLLDYAQKTNDTAVWGFYAQTFIRDENWPEAISAFENLKRNQNPIVRGKALYWQAYAEHMQGNDGNARKRLQEIHKEFPLTWYDMLAYQREEDWFGQNADEAYRALFRAEKDPIRDTFFHPWGHGTAIEREPSSNVWSQIKLLSRYDAIEEARSLYTSNESALLNGVPASERNAFRRYATHLVESYNKAWEDNSGSVRALSHIIPSRSDDGHKMAYPQPFAPLVESLSAQYGIPHYFIYGIMLQESRFRPWQVSSADAIGALQMIPKTARPIAKALGVTYDPDTFFDPRVGFPYSAYYMKMHYERWGHNLAFTAGSYNGGPHRIGPWALRDKGKTLDFIVDEFSFDESRHYARKVSEHTLRFTYLYARNADEWLNVVHELFPRVVPDIEPTDDWGL